MVQVDVFWSYGIGAGFAAANTRQIEVEQAAHRNPYEHRAFRDTLLYLACLFVPSGAFLVWSFPSWETMHVGGRDMPGWLVASFTMSNATQGLLGFAVAEWFLRRGQRYAAYLQWLLGYFAMLFVLVHGWDGTGYMRFLSLTRGELDGWTWATAARWLAGDVARSLLIMSPVVIPVMLWMMVRDCARGYALTREVSAADRARWKPFGEALGLAAVLLIGVLGAVILASVAIRYLGPLLGTPAAAALIYVLGLRRGGIFERHFRHLIYAEPFLGTQHLRAVPETRAGVAG